VRLLPVARVVAHPLVVLFPVVHRILTLVTVVLLMIAVLGKLVLETHVFVTQTIVMKKVQGNRLVHAYCSVIVKSYVMEVEHVIRVWFRMRCVLGATFQVKHVVMAFAAMAGTALLVEDAVVARMLSVTMPGFS